MMLRPPAGWDARTRKSTVPSFLPPFLDLVAHLISIQTRWIWGTDPLTDLQKTVAPKHCDASFLFLRCLILIFSSWILVLIASFSLVILPLATGRFVFYLYQIPISFYHEPVCFVLGFYVLQFLSQLALSLLSIVLRIRRLWKFFDFSSMKHGQPLPPLPHPLSPFSPCP
jgi:hypothetical protein